jgi:hypothetical protein
VGFTFKGTRYEGKVRPNATNHTHPDSIHHGPIHKCFSLSGGPVFSQRQYAPSELTFSKAHRMTRLSFPPFPKVNKIAKRATVLVPCREGQGELYRDGRRYLKFYVPPGDLKVL